MFDDGTALVGPVIECCVIISLASTTKTFVAPSRKKMTNEELRTVVNVSRDAIRFEVTYWITSRNGLAIRSASRYARFTQAEYKH